MGFSPNLWQMISPLAFKVRFPADSQSLCQIPRFVYHTNTKQKKTVEDRQSRLQNKKMIMGKEGCCIGVKGLNFPEDITSLSVFVPKHRVPNYVSHKLTQQGGETEESIDGLKVSTPLCQKWTCIVGGKSLMKYLTLCNPMNCSPPGSLVHGIILARILECVAISFSWGSS